MDIPLTTRSLGRIWLFLQITLISEPQKKGSGLGFLATFNLRRLAPPLRHIWLATRAPKGARDARPPVPVGSPIKVRASAVRAKFARTLQCGVACRAAPTRPQGRKKAASPPAGQAASYT